MTAPKKRPPHVLGPHRNLGLTNCAYDGGYSHGPECPNPATLHVIGNYPDGSAFMLASCDEHAEKAKTYGYDWHTYQGVCGMPGTYWQHAHSEAGESFCIWPEGDAVLAEALTEPIKANA